MQQTVILLNGPSSAGKTTIAAELKRRLNSAGAAAETVSIDDHMKLEPGEQIWEDDVFEIMPEMCAAITEALRGGSTVIVDHVITSERIYLALTDAVQGYRLLTVRVECSPEILRRREAARGDRFIGSAEESQKYLYPQEGYDIRVDSGKDTAAKITDLLAQELDI